MTGMIIGLYGALNDYEPVTLIGALLIVVALILPFFIDINKKWL